MIDTRASMTSLAASHAEDSHAREVAAGRRFEFGRNWARFLSGLDGEKIAAAQSSLAAMLGRERLDAMTFLDAGSGSGLFSLAARRLGASVVSFDYDPQSVACTVELRERYFPGDHAWRIERGSVLDPAFVRSLGRFDIVYSWGVLHHTGSMWQGMSLACEAVKPHGSLFVAIYNDQGPWSRRWTRIKHGYNRLPRALKLPYLLAVVAARESRPFARSLVGLRPDRYLRTWFDYDRRGGRGMNKWRDYVDWVGGYPFEVARPEEVIDYCRARGFSLLRLKTCAGGLACNEFVLEKDRSADR